MWGTRGSCRRWPRRMGAFP